MQTNFRKKIKPYLFLLPLIIILLSFIFSPMLYSLYLSFHSYNLTMAYKGVQFVGLRNYERFLFGGDFVNSLLVTLRFSICAVVIELVLGFSIALVLCRQFFGRIIVRTFILTPMLIAGVVVGAMWTIILNDQFGVINAIIGVFGIPKQAWLSNPSLVVPSLILTDVWQSTPFVILVLMAGMQSLPHELYEAAEVDGASYFQKLFRLTIPLLTPLILIVTTIRIMDAFRLADRVLVLTGGGPGTRSMVLNMYNYRETFISFNLGFGAAISWVILTLIMILSICLFSLSDRENTLVL